MTATTIKVDSGLRDKLKEQARAAGRTLAQQLDHLVRMEERNKRFAALRESIARTSPEDMESWRQETAEWERLEAPIVD